MLCECLSVLSLDLQCHYVLEILLHYPLSFYKKKSQNPFLQNCFNSTIRWWRIYRKCFVGFHWTPTSFYEYNEFWPLLHWFGHLCVIGIIWMDCACVLKIDQNIMKSWQIFGRQLKVYLSYTFNLVYGELLNIVWDRCIQYAISESRHMTPLMGT